MSLALVRVCATLDLPVQDDPATHLVAKKIIELAQRGCGQRAEFYHSEGVQIRSMTGLSCSQAERFNIAAGYSIRSWAVGGTKGWA